MTNYPVGDFLIRVKNVMLARKHTFSMPKTGLIKNVANALKRMGYLSEISENKGLLEVQLAYKSKEPILSNIKIISRPGLRVYKSARELASLKGPTTLLISTPQGVLSTKEALKKNVGGEIIAEVI
jgi:small subunit ribosomal protein S8